MVTAKELLRRNVASVKVSPGWVQTFELSTSLSKIMYQLLINVLLQIINKENTIYAAALCLYQFFKC